MVLLALSGCGSRTGLPLGEDTAPEAGVEAGLDAAPACPPGSALVLLLSDAEELYAIDLPTLTTRTIGPVACGTNLNTMAVSRARQAYVGSMTGALFAVDPDTAACTPTPFDPAQVEHHKFGMGFILDDSTAGERPYIAVEYAGIATWLGAIDTESYRVTRIGSIVPTLPMTELIGTADRRAYGFSAGQGEALLVEFDLASARWQRITSLPFGPTSASLDFAFWGGAFYLFLAPAGAAGSSVYRYRRGDPAPELIGELDLVVVGAGVSTCAPAQ
jgi:hypothetical protein